VRAFWAIELPDGVRREAAAAARALTQVAPEFRVPAESNLHLTVAFLGEISQDQVSSLTTALGAALYSWEPFTMSLRGAGWFPPRGRPRVAWIGVAEGGEACEQLALVVGRACAAAGAPADAKPFHPHLTVGRARDASRGEGSDRARSFGMRSGGLERWVRDLGDKPVGAPFRVDRIVLFESTLTPKGSIYAERGEARLGTRPGA
jgi:2'-5' RNA ligase